MDCTRTQRHWLGNVFALCLTGCLLQPIYGASDKGGPLRQAEQFEKAGRWAEAGDIYDAILRNDRDLPEIRERYLSCLRHVHLIQRLHDPGFKQKILNRDLGAALKVYGEVIARLQANYVDRNRTNLSRLFQQGVEELNADLQDAAFCQEFLPGMNLATIETFKNQLRNTWGLREVHNSREAQWQVRSAALAAQQALGLQPTVVVLEFACGACGALDEYTFFLTPGPLSDIYASLKGESVGIGIDDLAAENGKLVIKGVLLGSPAAREHLQNGDLISRIDKKPVDNLTSEAALQRLRGEAATTVELEVQSPGDQSPRTLTLTREAILMPSVLAVEMLDTNMGIGYFQLAGFQETTMQEMETAILKLKMQGMKVLILDLRDNPGGLFEVAVQVAEHFLADGVIVATHSPVASQNKTYEANNLEADPIPLVILIDGDTASAAEVVAGALKENRRATLVGQTTYGKGSIQCVLKLTTAPAGIRVTLAKFFSPLGHPYSGSGVTPQIIVERTSQGFDEAQRQAALTEARQLLMMGH